jgi:hypothetical protein
MFWFSVQVLSETFLILRSTEGDVIRNVYRSACKVPVIVVWFTWKLNLPEKSSNPLKISNLMLFHVWKDIHDEANSRYVKVKQPHYRPWHAHSVPEGWGSQILRQSAHEGGEVVSPTHRPPLSQEILLVIISVRGWIDPRAIVRPEELCQWKIPMKSSGIDPATFRFVAQCLNQQQHRVSPTEMSSRNNSWG